MASKPCALGCGRPVNEFDKSTRHEITAWVGGEKMDGATLREKTGRVAHEACVLKRKAGTGADQETIGL